MVDCLAGDQGVALSQETQEIGTPRKRGDPHFDAEDPYVPERCLVIAELPYFRSDDWLTSSKFICRQMRGILELDVVA